MILKFKDIQKIKDFLYKEATTEELDRCAECGGNLTCENKEFCERYTPDNQDLFLDDLIDTVNEMQEILIYEGLVDSREWPHET